MKREDKYPETEWFHLFNANPKKRVTGDCTFRAICTALEKPWETVVMEMAEVSCRTGYAINDKKGIERYLKEQGWIKMPQPKKANGTKYTGKQFCKNINRFGLGKTLRVIANIGGHHIVAIVDGKVWDTWDSTDGCVGNYWIKE